MDNPDSPTKTPALTEPPTVGPEPKRKARRGWAAMSLELRTELARRGGQASAKSAKHRSLTHEQAAEMGRRRWAVAKAKAAVATTDASSKAVAS